MLDIKFISENPEVVKQVIANKNEKNRIDDLLELDKQRREFIAHADELKSKRNTVSQQVGQMKKSGQDATEIIAEMKRVGDEIAEYDGKLRNIEEEIDTILRFIPNLPHSSVPVGKSAEQNVEVRQWRPVGFKFENEFKPLDHVELGK